MASLPTKKGLSPKLMRQWQGPYLVTKRINDMVYRVQLKPQTKPKVVHRNRLWRYSGSSFSSWLPETCAHDRDREQSEPNKQLQNEAQDKELELRRGQRNRRQPERFGFQCQLEASSSEEGEWCHRASV